MKQRIGDWIQVYSGGQMFPLDPRPEEMDIQDIAHSLAMQCRFNGHTKRFYSVAEHCCHVSDILPAEQKLTGLLHDASEAYLCDLPRPIKQSRGFAEKYLTAERQLEWTLSVRFGLDYPFESCIHNADNRMLATEALQLMAPLHPEWLGLGCPVEGLVLPCWSPEEAREEFLSRYFAIRTVEETPQNAKAKRRF